MTRQPGGPALTGILSVLWLLVLVGLPVLVVVGVAPSVRFGVDEEPTTTEAARATDAVFGAFCLAGGLLLVGFTLSRIFRRGLAAWSFGVALGLVTLLAGIGALFYRAAHHPDPTSGVRPRCAATDGHTVDCPRR